MKTIIPIFLASAALLLSPVAVLAEPAHRLVPDTLDLRENAKLSLNFLKGSMDTHQGGMPYFTIYYGADPVAMSHMVYDLDENPGRWLYAFLAARQVSGSPEGLKEEKLLEQYLYQRMNHNDGLVYLPKYTAVARLSHGGEAWMWGNRSAFMGLFSLYMVRDTADLKKRLDDMVDAVHRVALKGDVGLYLNEDYYAPGARVDSDKPALLGQNMCGWITPMVKYYEWTGNKKAWELAKGFTDYLVRHHADSSPSKAASAYGVADTDLTGDGRARTRKEQVLKISNTHGALWAIAGVLRVAEITGNKEHVAWAKRLVDYTAANLATSFGWVPEHEDDHLLGKHATQSSEACSVADLVNCCIYLARNGHPEYWNHVERYVRNYLEEAQLKNTDWMPQSVRKEDTIKETYTNVAERVKGAYLGWGDPNDLVNPTARNPHAIQNCCGPHCAWATSLVWHHIMRKEQNGLFVNLMLNRRTPWGEVLSHHPYEGRVDVELYEDNTVHILVPDWVNKADVKLQINGRQGAFGWAGPYVVAKDCKRGDKLTINYPMRLVTITDTVPEKGTYRTKWKGNTVVAIDPPGRVVPLFQRSHMLEDKAPMKQERLLEPGARVEIPLDTIRW